MTHTSAANPEAEKLNSYPLFDWLRFVLASIVVIGHAGIQFPTAFGGHMAVEVFFALSGWLIGGILLRTDRRELPRFFFNRSTRIWIPYALAIVLLYGVALLHEGASLFWFKYLLFDVTFTHQLFTIFPAALDEMPLDGSGNQFWSISVEEQFYLIAPLLILFVKQGKSLWLWLIIAIMLGAFESHFAAIALGVCAAIVESRTAFSASSVIRWTAVAVAVSTAGVIIWTKSSFWGPIFAVSTVIALAKPGRRARLAQTAGGLSYPLYLNHWIGVFAVNFVSKRWLPLDFQTFVLAQYVLNIAVALALYLAVDRQVQLRRGIWYSDELGKRLALTSYALVGTGLILGSTILLAGY
ncbi:MAG: acyltransferase [Alphaproteobacteria bacterium]|nr:acyltransferase [Alphaproteobacteria bacterium]MBU0864390.1 acyltransferase [Alphaproteobacteria bacterium]MBU1825601.1 acyltransferase [Alphaproteobacteria bacterium]